MTALAMDPAQLPPTGRALFAEMAAKRKARGEGFGGPYIALLNHPELARRIEELGFFLKFEGVLPRPIYQFIVLSVAQATGAAFEWHDHVEHALAAGLARVVVDRIANGQTDALGAPLFARACHSDGDDSVERNSGRVAGARRCRMGPRGTGRDRRRFRVLSDVRRHQSGLQDRG
jgi:hypothetical protein